MKARTPRSPTKSEAGIRLRSTADSDAMDIRLLRILGANHLSLGYAAREQLPPDGSLSRHLLVVTARKGTRPHHDECLRIEFFPRSLAGSARDLSVACYGGCGPGRTPVLFEVDDQFHLTSNVELQGFIRSGKALLQALESAPAWTAQVGPPGSEIFHDDPCNQGPTPATRASGGS